MKQSRLLHQTFLWSAMAMVIVVVIATGILTNITLRSVEKNLPNTLFTELYDLDLVLDDIAEIIFAAELTKVSPDSENFVRFRNKVKTAYDGVVKLRNTYVFDNMIQASAFHRVVAPAIADLQIWLSEGVSGYGPETETTVDIALSRISEVFQKARALNRDSQITAQNILNKQRNQLNQFVLSVNLLFMLTLAITFIMVFLLIRQYVLKRQEAASQAERKSAEEKYRILVENSNDSIFIAQDGVVKFPNRKTEELTGYSAEELARMPFINFIHPDDRESVMDKHKRRLRGERSASTYSFTIIHKSGFKRTTQVNTVLIQWEERPATLNFIRDITKQTELESRLRQAQKMEAIGTLAGGIAHDFNNILFPLMGYAEMLKLDLPVGSPLHGHVDEILHAALRSKELVKQILTFSRKGDQDIKPIKLQPTVNEALKLLRSSIPTTIDIQQNIDPDCGVVVADPTQIHQIIMNLTTNAYHAVEETGGMLKVNLKQVRLESDQSVFLELTPGEYVRLTVADTGIGIEKDVMDKIFDPYFTTKETGKGTGLGLSVVLGIVKNCNGDIRINSEPGKGTEIQVYLPIMDRKVDDIKTDRSEPVRGGTEKILLVDDEETILRMEQQMLERLGYRITTRTGSVDALEAFKANPDSFDLIITDMTMPNMTGVQLAGEIKRIRPDIPVILCTGFSYQINDEKSKALGIQGFIMKPVIMKEIAAKIRMVLEEEK